MFKKKKIYIYSFSSLSLKSRWPEHNSLLKTSFLFFFSLKMQYWEWVRAEKEKRRRKADTGEEGWSEVVLVGEKASVPGERRLSLDLTVTYKPFSPSAVLTGFPPAYERMETHTQTLISTNSFFFLTVYAALKICKW